MVWFNIQIHHQQREVLCGNGSQLTFTSDTYTLDTGETYRICGASSGDVTAFYGRTGNVVLKSTDNISVNDITD